MKIDWLKIYKKLKLTENPSFARGGLYYAGGTLSVPLSHDSFMGLNIDGRAFDTKGEYVQPDWILRLVRKLYLETKGMTDHFVKTVGPMSFK